MEREFESPPADADEWSNEQWIKWLEATDEAAVGSVDAAPAAAPAPLARSTGGQVIGNAMIGLAQALYGRQKPRPVIVVERGEPEDDLLELHLDFDHPEDSYVVLREEPPQEQPEADQP